MEKPIDLDYPTKVIEDFLLLAVRAECSDFHSLGYAIALIELANKFECEGVKRLYASCLARNVSRGPWIVFVIASRLDDLYLAKLAISQMGQAEDWIIEGEIRYGLEGTNATLSYLCGLMHGIVTNRASSNPNKPGQAYTDYSDFCWKNLADNFLPGRPEKSEFSLITKVDIIQHAQLQLADISVSAIKFTLAAMHTSLIGNRQGGDIRIPRKAIA